MSVTMDEMNAKIEAGEARGETRLVQAMQEVHADIGGLRGELQQELLRQRVWVLITAIFIVASTVSILSYLDYGREARVPVIINVPSGLIDPPR